MITLMIKPQGTSTWKNARTEWGMSLSDGSLSKLLTPAPNKEPIKNANAITDGSSVVGGIGVKAERTVNLEVHFIAPDQSTFLSRYAAFCSDVLDKGAFDLKTSVQDGVVYHFIYLDCQQFSQFHLELAKFTLSLVEPNPSNRT